MQEYRANGVQLGWLLNPHDRQVEVYRLGKSVEVLDHPSVISGDPLLPEFNLNLSRIFQ